MHCTPHCGFALPTSLGRHVLLTSLFSLHGPATPPCGRVSRTLCVVHGPPRVAVTHHSLCGCTRNTPVDLLPHPLGVVLFGTSRCGGPCTLLCGSALTHLSVAVRSTPLGGRGQHISLWLSLCMTPPLHCCSLRTWPVHKFRGVLHINISINFCRNVSNISNAPPFMCVYYP